MNFSDLSRKSQALLSLVAAGIGFTIQAILITHSLPREYWLLGWLEMLVSTGFAGGCVGALLGKFWRGFLVGFLLPIVAFFLLGGYEQLC